MSSTRDKTAIVVLSSLGFGVADLMLPVAWAICLDIGRRHSGVVTGSMNMAAQLSRYCFRALTQHVNCQDYDSLPPLEKTLARLL